jgi:hypothetical protein
LEVSLERSFVEEPSSALRRGSLAISDVAVTLLEKENGRPRVAVQHRATTFRRRIEMEISRTLFRGKTLFLALLVALLAAARAEAQIGSAVPNWTVPASSSSTASSAPAHAHALADVTNPDAFVGVAPCRIVDTRGPTGPYGAPSLSAGVSRNFALTAGPCPGFPGSIAAYSLNITVTNTLGPGFIKIYPQGGPPPSSRP